MTSTDQWWEDTIVTNPFLWEETTMGIDWGETTNAWSVVGYRGKVLANGFVDESPDGLRTLMSMLEKYAHPENGDLPPVAIESPRRLLVAGLHANGVEVVPLNPKSVKAARGVKNARNASKTDPKDAILIADTLRTHPTHYHSLHEATQDARAITLLSRAKDEAVTGAVRQASRIRSALAEYYPNANAAFPQDEMGKDLQAYWVLHDALTPAAGARLRRDGIETRLMKPGGRGSKKGLPEAVDRIYTALRSPALAYPDQFEAAFAETVRTDLEVLRAAVEHRMVVGKRLETAVKAHPMYALLLPATGAGIGAIAGLIAEMSDDPYRFETADGLMAFAGSAPAINQSGASTSIRRREVKGNRLHKALWHWAESAAQHEPAAIHYYWTMRRRGCAHPHAVRKIINKLLRGVHACIKNGVIWDDARIWKTNLTDDEINDFRVTVKAELKALKQQTKKTTTKAVDKTPTGRGRRRTRLDP